MSDAVKTSAENAVRNAAKKTQPKRFYEKVQLQARTDAAGGYEVLLDGRALKTPQKNPLHPSTQELANALAAEWDAQKETINADAMPITRIHAIAIDRVPFDRPLMQEDILRYLETDLLCYRASAASALHAHQAEMYDPVIKQFNLHYGVILQVTDTLMPVAQPAAAFDAVAKDLNAMDAFSFAAIALITPLLGSLVLAISVWQQTISGEQAFALARLDETHAAKRYGADPTLEASLLAKAHDVAGGALVLQAAHP
jgi:chaperone required for assembly of F1-ATPase